MNYSDHRLESDLRLLLDPVVNTPAPPRKGRRLLGDERQALEPILIEPIVLEPIEAFA